MKNRNPKQDVLASDQEGTYHAPIKNQRPKMIDNALYKSLMASCLEYFTTNKSTVFFICYSIATLLYFYLKQPFRQQRRSFGYCSEDEIVCTLLGLFYMGEGR